MIENRIIIHKGREDRRLSFSVFRTHCRTTFFRVAKAATASAPNLRHVI